ncbi:MAG: NAD(+) diphosphatase [Lachnospira sp.]|nr:NAD(+) diphosphatase [Lachnospira sp.]
MIQDILPKHFDNQYKRQVPQAGDYVLLFEGTCVLAKQEAEELVCPTYEMLAGDFQYIYLFSVDEEKYFLAMEKCEVQRGVFAGEMADADVHQEYVSVIEGFEFIGVNTFRMSKPKDRAFAVITAYHLYGWYRDNKRCGRCGDKLVHDDKERMLRCPVCKNMVYPKISPAVIVGVTNGSKLLLTKYAGRTYKNYALIAGFTEIGETLEQTVEREVMEEVGLKVKNIRYYKSQPWALSGSLLAGFYCELDGDDTIRLQEEELSVGEWVEAEDIDPEDDGISLTREMIVNFRNNVVG